MGSRFCKSCGAEITEDRPGSCPKCGAAPSTSDIKNPVLAAVLSLIIPGLGQSYNGNALKGIGIFLGLIILWIINLLMYSEALFIGIIGILILWIIGVYDAYRDAGQMNRGEIPEKKHQMLLFGGVAVVVVIVLAAIMFLVVIALFASMYTPPLVGEVHNDQTAEIRVQYNGSVFADYGIVDCYSRKNITSPKVLRFAEIMCPMNYATFRKNETGPGELRVDLVRDGRVVKSYTTVTKGVWFWNVKEFLQRVSKEPELVQETPVTVRILTDGEWIGSIDDKYGSQSDSGSGSATLTLTQPVLPVNACVRNPDNVPSVPITIEIYARNVLLKRSDVKDGDGQICVKISQFTP
jgi:hypothetical protein